MMLICKAQLLLMPFPAAGALLGPLVTCDKVKTKTKKDSMMKEYRECGVP